MLTRRRIYQGSRLFLWHKTRVQPYQPSRTAKISASPNRMMPAISVLGTDRQSAALQQVAAAYCGVTDLTNGVRGGLWPGGSTMCRLVGAGGGRVLSLAPTHRPKMSNLRSTARRMAGWQVSWARTAALGGMKPAARVSHSLLAGSGIPACPE